MSISSQQQHLIWLAIALLPICGRTQEVKEDEIMAAQAKDLAVLGMTLAHYKVDSVSPTAALEAVWVAAIGAKPDTIEFEYASPHSPEPKITLDLKDTKASVVIGYIAELSARKWVLCGRNGFLLHLSLIEIHSSHDGCHFSGSSFELKQSKAKNLGIQPGMEPRHVMDVLRRYGVKFDSERYAMAAYDDKFGILCIVAGASEVAYVGCLVRLLNAGMTIQKKEGKAQ